VQNNKLINKVMNSKKILLSLTILMSLGLILSPANADYKDGLIAFENQDFRLAAKEWKLLAEKGDAKSQTNLGILYFNGKGVLKDYKKAVDLLKSAANQGEAEAQFILGKIYVEGDGVPKSLKTAKIWVALAYENNFDGAEALWNDYKLWKY
jgi:TPR repeat protein